MSKKHSVNFVNINKKIFNPESIPGLNAPKIDARFGLINNDTSNTSCYCIGKITTAQSIANLNGIYLNFNSFDTNISTMSSTNGQITISTPGVYVISVSVQWDNGSGGNPTRKTYLYINGNQVAFVNNMQVSDFTGTLNYIANLQTNDTIKVQVYHDKGSALNVLKDFTYLQVASL